MSTGKRGKKISNTKSSSLTKEPIAELTGNDLSSIRPGKSDERERKIVASNSNQPNNTGASAG